MIRLISRRIINKPSHLNLFDEHLLEDYCSVATASSWTQILNDKVALEATSRASLYQVATKFKQWPLELAFNIHRGGSPLCPHLIALNIATLIATELDPLEVPEI